MYVYIYIMCVSHNQYRLQQNLMVDHECPHHDDHQLLNILHLWKALLNVMASNGYPLVI